MLTLIAAQTLDGFIARANEPGTGFCSEEDALFLKSALQDFDSLIMGRKTYDTLRERIQSSTTDRWLRKIITRKPDHYRPEEKPELIEFTRDTPEQVLAELSRRGRKRTALLGGGEIYSQYLAAGLVDELWLSIEPKLFGQGTALFRGNCETDFQLQSSEQLGANTLLLKYSTLRVD